MSKKQARAAIIYDFDGTLSPINMQEHEFIPRLGMNHREFWKKVKDLSKEQNACEILCYMHTMLEEARHKNLKVSKEIIKSYGKNLELFKGVESWFDHINKFSKDNCIKLEHYVISSGIKPLIEGTSIAKHFESIFACDFIYDADGKPIAPGVAVDYTAKTQYIFRINKGCIDQHDSSMINDHIPEKDRPVPIENMIYIGDGSTDVPAMKMTKLYGGLSICVYKPRSAQKKEYAKKLKNQGRVNIILPADYSENKQLSKTVKAKLLSILHNNALRDQLKQK